MIGKWIMNEKTERQPTKPSPLPLILNIKENPRRTVILLTRFMWASLSSPPTVFWFISFPPAQGLSWIALRLAFLTPLLSFLRTSRVVRLWLKLLWEAGAGQVRGLQRCEKAHGVTNAFEASILGFRHVFLSRCKAQRENGWMETQQSLRLKFSPRSTRLKEEADCFTIFSVDVRARLQFKPLFQNVFVCLHTGKSKHVTQNALPWNTCHEFTQRCHQVHTKNMSNSLQLHFNLPFNFTLWERKNLHFFKEQILLFNISSICNYSLNIRMIGILLKTDLYTRLTHRSPGSNGTTPSSVISVKHSFIRCQIEHRQVKAGEFT